MNLMILATTFAIIFFSVGMYGYHRHEAMWFWSSPVYQMKKIQFHDIETFNHKVGLMWILFAIFFFIPTPLFYLHIIRESIYVMLLTCILTIGLLCMMIYWHHLFQLHRDTKKH